MSKQVSANVMFARRCLQSFSRDLEDALAKSLCNQIDRALRLEDRLEFNRLLSLTPTLVQDDTDPWRIKERLQVISLIRFPIWDLDERMIFESTRDVVSSLSMNLSFSDREIWKKSGSDLSKVLDFDITALRGKHGPGIVAETSDPTIKRDVCYVNRSMRKLVPAAFRVPSNDGTWCRQVFTDRPAKVVLVPKDHKTLRVISAEPASTQFVQQGVWCQWERNFKHNRVFRHLRLRDQSSQHKLLHGGCATIDLSCASDTIRVKHLLLLSLPLYLKEKILALRTAMQSFKGNVYPTQGLFPMGAATCFPFETALFFSLARNYSFFETGRYPTTLGVYGDDICIDPALAGGFIAFLKRSGFLPNVDKSFVTGFFGETCGLYLYKGIDVTPVKLKRLYPTSPLDVSNIAYSLAATKMKTRQFTSLGLYLESLLCFVPAERWNSNYQRREIQCIVEKPVVLRSSRLGFYEALQHGCGDIATEVYKTSLAWQPVSGLGG